MEEEGRKCRFCRQQEESLNRVFEECEITGNEKNNWQSAIDGKENNLAKLLEMGWKKKEQKE